MARPPATLFGLPAAAAPKSRRSWRRLVLRGVFTLLWAVPFLVLLAIGIGLVMARMHGLTPISIRSGSMEPTIPTYALAFMEHAPPDDIVRGDIITFDPPGRHSRVTHRVTRRYEYNGKLLFDTRGDANPSTDDWRTAEGAQGDKIEKPGGGYTVKRQQRGISYGSDTGVRYVFHVPWLGYGGVLLERPEVRRYAPYVPFLLLGIWALAVIWVRPDSKPAHSASATGIPRGTALPGFGPRAPLDEPVEQRDAA